MASGEYQRADVVTRARRLWNTLTMPHDTLRGDANRRRARLLASLLLGLAALLVAANTVGMLLLPLLFPSITWGALAFWPVLVISLAILGVTSYGLALERRWQRAHQDNTAEIRAILTAYPELIVRISAEGIVTDYQTGDDSAPYNTPEAFLGRPITDIVPQDQAGALTACVREALDTGSSQSLEYTLTMGGEERWFEARIVPYRADAVLGVLRDVTEHHTALEMIQRSEKSRQALTDALPDLLFRFDTEGNFIDYKPAKIGLLLPSEMFLGKNVREVMPQLADQTLNAIARALETGTVQVFEYQLPAGDVLHTYEARLSPGGPDNVIAIVRDVTDQRTNQAQLRESEARYRALFEDSPISLWEEDFSAVRAYIQTLREAGHTDLASYFYQRPDEVLHCARLVTILNVNQATLDFLDVAVQSTLFETLEPIIDDEWIRFFRREIVSFAQGMSRFEMETTYRAKDGTTAYAIVTAIIAPGYEDTWGRVYVSTVDITERKRTEEALATSERQLDLALDGAELGLWDWNLRTNDYTVNTWWAAMLGYRLDEVTPHISTWDDALHPDDRARVWAAYHAHLDGFAPAFEAEYRLRANDGRWVWVLDRGKIVERDAAGAPLRMVGTHLDITSRKHVEESERDQRAFTEALRDISTVLSSTLDRDEVLEHIMTNVGRVVPHDASSVSLIDNGTVKVLRSRGYEQHGIKEAIEAMRMEVADYPTLHTMSSTRQPLIINNTRTDPQWKQLGVSTTMHAYLGAPIVWDGNVAGFLGLQSTQPDFFTRTHAERLHAFAEQAAIALRNAQLYDMAQRRLAEMEALRESLLEITSQLNLDALLEMLTDYAIRLIDVAAGGIYLYLPDEDVLEWAVRAGDSRIPIGIRLKRGEGMSGRVLENKQPLIVNDYNHWEGHSDQFDDDPYSSVIGVPIIWQGQLLGVLNAAAEPSQRAFNDHDLWLLTLFANQAAIAIQNARLFEAESQQRALAEALRDTAAAINSTLDLDEILDHLLVAVERVVSHDAANILLFGDDYAYTARHRGYEPYGITEYFATLRVRFARRPVLRRLIETGAWHVVPDTRTDPIWEHTDETAWIRAHVAVPIRSEQRVIGTLNLDSATPNAFTPRDAERVQAFADQVALAINNARLYAEVRRHRDQLEQRVLERTLDLSVRNAVAGTLSSSLDTSEMLTGVLRVISEQLHTGGGAIYLPDGAHRTLVMVATHGIAADTLTGVVPMPEPHSSRWDTPARVFAQSHDVSLLSAPFWQKGRIEGVIVLAQGGARSWTESERSMLDAIGRQIGVALANARSYASAVQGEARIRTILESVTDALLVFDKDDALILMNPAAKDLFNFYALAEGGEQRAAQLLWAWLRDYEIANPNQKRIEFAVPVTPLIVDDPQRLHAACDIKACKLAAGKNPAWPCWLYPGTMRPEESKQCALYEQARQLAIQAQNAAVRDDTGDVLGTVIVLNDVTHFRELDELKGRFVSTVSHELRTPLSTILLQVSTLLKYYERFNETERLAMIQEIQEQSQVLRNLIEDILELSRFDANRSLPQKQWIDLVATSHEVLGSMELVIRERNIKVDTATLTGSRYVMGDPNQLQRILRNLLNNAVKYTPPGGAISVSLRQKEATVMLEVSDTGIGIAPDDLEYIFDRFYRSKDAIDMASGTGLGLSITKEIVELHGGRIDVKSRLGEGSTFTVYLPVGGSEMPHRP